MNRHLALSFFQQYSQPSMDAKKQQEKLNQLMDKCESDFEKKVLQQINDHNLPLPDEAQKTIYDNDEPIAEADFYYQPNLLIFVDGSPHRKKHIADTDKTKRTRLKKKGYRILSITEIQETVDKIKKYLGLD